MEAVKLIPIVCACYCVCVCVLDGDQIMHTKISAALLPSSPPPISPRLHTSERAFFRFAARAREGRAGTNPLSSPAALLSPVLAPFRRSHPLAARLWM